jgi:GT2 family glycosyltransferase
MAQPDDAPGTPTLSVVVLAWDNLDLTRRCVESIREHTDVPYELIIVDNGSAPEAASFAAEAADIAVLNPRNLGFAVGMNQGLARASGDFVAFVNNDTTLPTEWASRLVECLDSGVGIVLPAVTASGNPYAIRSEPGTGRLVVPPFRHLPSGVVYLMETSTVRALGGWGEEFIVASREDLDLLFKVWANGLDVVLDERVLVDHVGGATADTKLEEKAAVWKRNRDVFTQKWMQPNPETIPRLADCSESDFADGLERAATTATWMDRMFQQQDRAERFRREVRELKPQLRECRRAIREHERRAQAQIARRRPTSPALLWTWVNPVVPPAIRQRFRSWCHRT